MFKKLSPKNEKIKVHNPATKLFLKDGEEVEYNQYWRRRVKEGDVVFYKEEIKKVITKKQVTSNRKSEEE